MLKFINKFLPSSKFKIDPFVNFNKLDMIQPISLSDLSLIKPIQKKILGLIDTDENISISKSNKFMSLIIPYRHRQEHLDIFLPYMKQYLESQKVEYEIIIVEQSDDKPFNRAKLMNIGALNANEKSNYFVFHDVDLLPQNIDYRYCNHSQKLFSFIEINDKYKEFKETNFGGVVLVPKKIFFNINGFSNNYWQWGKEDDDFLMRHLFKGYIPLLDKHGKLRALPHEASKTRDNKGNYVTDKAIIKENEKLYQKNRQHFSDFKRGFSSQDQDGISSIKDYIIDSITTQKNIKILRVTLS